MTDAAPARVAVVGGGWAGCAAAVTLAAAGFPVTLIEQAPTLGGRARRVVQHGIEVDNGQHVLLGAYRQTLALVADV
ncbi:MAG TPA: FAD-dependent oxidoreductase, partial [Burkholderiaceae bacterium]|nr:FAD-dependent oxidoreductase [Burkholderiaceae bacterium]